MRRLDTVMAKGFDLSTDDIYGTVRVGCSQCDALVINGVRSDSLSHGKATHECHGCNAQVPMRVKYCDDCR